MKRGKIAIMLSILTVAMLMVPAGSANDYFTNWQEGDEEDITGHSFEEEYWTANVENTTENGETVRTAISYVNYNNIQCFLLALENITDSENGTGTLPYQMFGMHYYTPSGEEVFIGALLAFLMAYQDNNSNNISDPDEKRFYIVPFGLSGLTMIENDYKPEVEVLETKKLGEGHYTFGMTYRNLYAFISETPLLSLALRTGWLAKFSELTITYNIVIDPETGQMSAETFYTIGQVTKLCGVLAGIPFPVEDSKISETIEDNKLGLAAVHFVSVFTSNYKATNEVSGTTLSDNINEAASGNITVDVGNNKDERAFKVGLRGTFDLIDEGTDPWTTEESGNDAFNLILQAKAKDYGLILWQLGFSAKIFSVFAYGLSSDVREKFSSPQNLAQQSLNPFSKQGFRQAAFWYAVEFPNWKGLRIEHDPVYTAYFDPAGIGAVDDAKVPGFEPFLLLTSIIVMALVARRRRLAWNLGKAR